MNNFVFLAIRPLDSPNRRFLKNLTVYKPYIFHQAYHFQTSKDSVTSVTYTAELDDDLYTIKRKKPNDLQVKIAAVVGKNGSGKSALFELVFLSAYVIANKQGILKDNLVKTKKRLELEQAKTGEDRSIYNINDLTRQVEENEKLFAHFAAELYFVDGKNIKCIRVQNGEAEYIFYEPSGDNKTFLPTAPKPFSIDNTEVGRYFYSIVINYSLYGLNARRSGQWLTSLFHKNDGYQTPLVINPYREDGDIHVNSELHLAQSRLIANLTDKTMTTKSILKAKPIKHITFSFSEMQLKEVEGTDVKNDLFNQEIKYGQTTKDIFTNTYKILLNETFDLAKAESEVPHFDAICLYVFKKLLKIAIKYYPSEGYHLFSNERREVEIPDLEKYLKFLALQQSHVTLKLKQILNCVKFNLLREEGTVKWNKNQISIPIEMLEDRLKKAVPKKGNFEPLEFMPAAFFQTNFVMTDGSEFHALSSGEQHLIHTTQAVLYHLINLNTVFNRTGQRHFKHVLLMLDEVELYFHPDFQKRIVSELLSGIKHLSIPKIESLNILFSTHSPFILSDIPKRHVLKVDEGIPQPAEIETFGANIHDLLADSFFLKGGFMGLFAQQQIKTAIDFMEGLIEERETGVKKKSQAVSDWSEPKIRELKDLIGEPVLKRAFEDLYFKAFSSKLDEEIARLMQLKNSKKL